jgi:hypothetical protein
MGWVQIHPAGGHHRLDDKHGREGPAVGHSVGGYGGNYFDHYGQFYSSRHSYFLVSPLTKSGHVYLFLFGNIFRMETCKRCFFF